MSVPAAPIPESTVRKTGQFAAGMVVVIIIFAALLLLGRIPWGFTDPVLDLIGRNSLVNAVVKGVLVFHVIALSVLFLIWWERKFAGWMQARLGPMHVGWKGLAQTLADAAKLLFKEDIVPTKADKPLFYLAPYLVFVPTVVAFMVLPFSLAWIGYDYPLAALFVIAVTSTAALGILAAGWGGNNKYSLIGGVRGVAQLISYEIPMLVVVLSMVTIAGTMSMIELVRQQEGLWNIIRHAPIAVPGFLIYLVASMAEVNRAPFDLPEAESELVAGFHTEYSGMRWSFFFLAEFANNFFTAGFGVVLFFGGWLGPWLPGPIWFILKTLLLITVMMWIRWTVPRLRIDQMMAFAWKVLVPISLVLFCASAVWALGVRP